MSRMPALFIGHGSPMNAIADNSFTKDLARLGQSLPEPKAILCISAHWMTEGSLVTAQEQPKTIHDFYGFPRELFAVEYAAPGASDLARSIALESPAPKIHSEDIWGLDHGSWSVLRHMYPDANIPVVQLSIPIREKPERHFEIGRQLRYLREQGVLILGSGNIVHNLRTIDWNAEAKPFEWALEYDDWVKGRLLARDEKALVNRFLDTEAARLSVPTLEHYLPLLYVLGASEAKDEVRFDHEGIQNASISMRAVSFY